MTLRRKMTFQIGAMMLGLLMVSAAALWGVSGLRSDFGIASSGYRELREIYEVAAHVDKARTLLGLGDRTLAAMEIDRALTKLDLTVSREQSGSALRQSADGVQRAAAFRDSIKRAAALLQLPEGDEAFHAGAASANDAINQAYGAAIGIAGTIQKTISQHEQAANARWRQTIILVAAVSTAIILAAAALGIIQYRSVITPLQRLGDAARKMAAGRFGDRVKTGGAAEFSELADDFNRMARELESLYRELEQKVATKSRELVRSERLASVGYLAAGVAHEINNPLSVITGYGERAIQQLERGGDNTAALKNLRIMCEEAYRCKAITDKLLTLARPGEEARQPVALSQLAAEVVALVEGLPAHRERKLVLVAKDDAMVLGSGGELKQVLLNLTLNAMEAVKPVSGEVTITVEALDGTARLTVADNGRGMSRETIERVFEPFFTEKRGSQGAGTGLGLSISHAIVESHGGIVRARSEGSGKGSEFIVELPLATLVPSSGTPGEG
jgi:signal transduction histidine kinase